MRIANKIAIGSVILLVLLIAVLAYQVVLVRRTVATSRDLADRQTLATETLLRQATLRNNIGNLAQKLALLQDAAYARRLSEFRNGDAAALLVSLGQLDLSLEVQMAAREVRSDWESFWESLPIAEALERVEDSLPTSTGESLSGMEPSPPAISEGVEAESERMAREREAAVVRKLEDLDTAIKNLIEVNQAAVEERVDASDKARRRAERISLFVAATVAFLSLVIGSLTARSITEPLRRLTRATRAVAEGRFSYQLPTRGHDEFAGLAEAFNSMVHRLGRLDQMKQDFVAHVSHELKNPLVAMQETNQLLAEEIPGELNSQQRRLLDLNVQSGKRLSAMLSNLLDMSSLEAGAVSYALRPHDVRELVSYVLAEFEARARDQGVALAFGEPRPEAAPVALCDRDRIIQVLENLVENALKFTPAGGTVELDVEALVTLPKELPETLRGRLSGWRRRAYVHLIVSDTGPGVADDLKEAVFLKFHQVGGHRKDSNVGVGLGLAICREIVEAHKGVVWVADRAGGGSRFQFLLPAASQGAFRRSGMSFKEPRTSSSVGSG